MSVIDNLKSIQQKIALDVRSLQYICNGVAREPGYTGESLELNNEELFCSMHSDLAKAFDGSNKNMNDDDITERRMEEVRLANCIMQIFVYACKNHLDIGGALIDILNFNVKKYNKAA